MLSNVRRHASLLLLTLAALFGCSDAPEDAEQGMVPVADVANLMFAVLEPAAETYWDAVGWILDYEGETFIRPQSPEEWSAVRDAGIRISESGNLLMVPGRGGADDAEWMAYARGMRDVGQRAIEAAESEDPQAVFDVGADVYFVCTSCHAAYSPDILRPNQTTDPAGDMMSPDTGSDTGSGSGGS